MAEQPDATTSATQRSMRQRRRHTRVAVSGKVRLVADSPNGLVTLAGSIIDLSLSGCAIKVFAPLTPAVEARLELTLDGRRILSDEAQCVDVSRIHIATHHHE